MKTIARRSLIALSFAIAIGFVAQAETGKNESKPVRTVACPPECGFTVSSRDEQEVIDAVKLHAKTHHQLTLSDDQVRGMLK